MPDGGGTASPTDARKTEMKKETFKKCLPWIHRVGTLLFLCSVVWHVLNTSADRGNPNILTDIIYNAGTIHDAEFERITVHHVPYELVDSGDLPEEVRGITWYFVGYITDGEHSLKIHSPGSKWKNHIPDYLWAMYGYEAFFYERVGN